MKKIFYLIIVLVGLVTVNVKAANYEFNELIPANIKNTLVTNNFSYRKFYYDGDGKVVFGSIKNLSDKELPISISIAFFDENRKNMGIMNFCSKDDMIKSKEEIEYTINVTSSEIAKGMSVKGIKYIAIITDNINCNTERSFDYVGHPVEDIGLPKNNTIDRDSQYLLNIMTVVGAVLLILFLYRYLCTTAYQNMDGSETRAGFRKYNKDLKKEREEELKRNPPKPKEKVKVKTDKVIAQEEAASKEDKSGTDLHNLYK